METMKQLFIYGPPASGKTTLGQRLAQAVGWQFLDLDAEIEKTANRPIKDIFATDGEPYFRQLESETLKRISDSTVSPVIISLGGGTLLNPSNRALAESKGPVWCLEAPSDAERARRIANGGDVRPLGDKSKERAGHYASFSNRIATSFDLPGSLVIVGTNLGAPDYFADLVIADENAWSFHRQESATTETIPSGEKYKTLETVTKLWGIFGKHGLGRRNRVASFGGGVTSDLTGFAAATWMRGIDWISYPTTLLSMVDASTGGKTGCDLPEGKNLVGAFHPPALVIADTLRLTTLPEQELRNGRAEMIKHEIIAGLAPCDFSQPVPSAAEIARNLAVKVEIVRNDPFEKSGKRLLLNCGHTVGHAVEIASGFTVSHGEAVAIGCVEEAWLAARLGKANIGWADELAARFRAAGLPTSLPAGMTFESLKPIMRGDKKRNGDSVTFALPCGNGNVLQHSIPLTSSLRGESLGLRVYT